MEDTQFCPSNFITVKQNDTGTPWAKPIALALSGRLQPGRLRLAFNRRTRTYTARRTAKAKWQFRLTLGSDSQVQLCIVHELLCITTKCSSVANRWKFQLWKHTSGPGTSDSATDNKSKWQLLSDQRAQPSTCGSPVIPKQADIWRASSSARRVEISGLPPNASFTTFPKQLSDAHVFQGTIFAA